MVLIIPTPLASFVAARDPSVRKWRVFFRSVAIFQVLVGLLQVFVTGEKDGVILFITAIFCWRFVQSSLTWFIFVALSLLSVGTYYLFSCFVRTKLHFHRYPYIVAEGGNHSVSPTQIAVRVLVGLVNLAAGGVAIRIYRGLAPTDRTMFQDIVPLIRSEAPPYAISRIGGDVGQSVAPFTGSFHQLSDGGRESFVVAPPSKGFLYLTYGAHEAEEGFLGEPPREIQETAGMADLTAATEEEKMKFLSRSSSESVVVVEDESAAAEGRHRGAAFSFGEPAAGG